MEGIAAILQAINGIISPVLAFLVWAFPVKIYWLHDGQRGAICTLGKVRKWRISERGPGITLCGPFEELSVVQAEGRYVDLAEQILMTSDKKVVHVNAALLYNIINVRKAMLKTNQSELFVSGVAMDVLRQWANHKKLTELNSEKVTKEISGTINQQTSKYGCRVKCIMLTDLRPHPVQMACDCLENVASRLLEGIGNGRPD